MTVYMFYMTCIVDAESYWLRNEHAGSINSAVAPVVASVVLTFTHEAPHTTR